MARKKSNPKIKHARCAHCNVIVPDNAPMEGMIYEWNGKIEAICCNCGHKVVRLFKIMNQRWG